MAEKLFASLSSGLLARKGAARPAMRPQGFGQMGATVEDLGWNDMGFEPPKPSIAAVRDADHDAFGVSVPEPSAHNPLAALTPVSPVHGQQARIAERLIKDEPVVEVADIVPAALPSPGVRRSTVMRAAPGGKAKAAFTLRLDPDRHLKLRLACAVTGRSAQMLVTDALDRMLDAMPEVDGMAASAPRKSRQH